MPNVLEGKPLTALVWEEQGQFVSLCPELDVASAGDTREEARAMLKEAVEILLETADEAEIRKRFRGGMTVTTFEVDVA
ncbi:MAG: type II toxin-antitoxin system HicB family antitoxin [Phycisphaerae bacterium]